MTEAETLNVYKDARQLMREKIADFRKETAAERLQRREEICSRCAYMTSENKSYGNCDYIGYKRHQRPCAPSKCVEMGVFRPSDEKLRRRRDLTIKHVRTNNHLFIP